MTSAAEFDVAALLHDWAWLVPASHTPLLVSIFGDWVAGAPDGSLWALSLLEGNYRRVAADSDEFNQLKSSFDWLDKEFLAGWQEIAERSGLVPGKDECLGWRFHPALGGKFEASNLQVFSMLIYQSLMGQLHRQLRG